MLIVRIHPKARGIDGLVEANSMQRYGGEDEDEEEGRVKGRKQNLREVIS